METPEEKDIILWNPFNFDEIVLEVGSPDWITAMNSEQHKRVLEMEQKRKDLLNPEQVTFAEELKSFLKEKYSQVTGPIYHPEGKYVSMHVSNPKKDGTEEEVFTFRFEIYGKKSTYCPTELLPDHIKDKYKLMKNKKLDSASEETKTTDIS